MEHVTPVPISGFPEWSPGLRLAEQSLIDNIRRQYELYGFSPIETPAIERMQVLTAKSGLQRQIFTIGRPADDDGEVAELGLHFDLTVPLARYVAQHADELIFPFRRYQIQKVWRGERAQRGRFREFLQCDIDIVGSSSLDLVHDAEILATVNAVFAAIGHLPGIQIRVSNRKILSALLSTAELSGDQVTAGLRAIDKHGTQSADSLETALAGERFPEHLIDAVTALLRAQTLEQARQLLRAAGAAPTGVDELERVVETAVYLGVPTERLRVDYSIARGLDYYTGTVCETFVLGNEQWGSVCSGGRYDDLASYYTWRKFQGVGASIGLTRLFDLLIHGEYISAHIMAPTKVLIAVQNRARYLADYLGLARTLRSAGIPTEVYLEPAPLRDQIAYASAVGMRAAVIAGASEFENDTVTVRDLHHHVQETVTGDDLVRYISRMLQD